MANSLFLKVINFIWFQTIWWLVILMQSASIPYVLALFLLWFVLTPTRKIDGKLMLLVMLVGATIDSLLMYCSVFYFTEDAYVFTALSMWMVPLWLVLLWGAFAATLAHSLDTLRSKPLLAALVGGIFAPLSYLAGANFGAVDLGYSLMTTYITLCVVCGFTLPGCFVLLDKLSAPFELELAKRR